MGKMKRKKQTKLKNGYLWDIDYLRRYIYPLIRNDLVVYTDDHI